VPSNYCCPSTCHHLIGVIDHMNTKMILAALALSLSLAACAKKDEAPVEAAQEAAAAATEAAEAAGEAAAEAAEAAGEAAAEAVEAATDAATAPAQ
jgi:uncharacterized lipoprotein NlpE involved in copper resistance